MSGGPQGRKGVARPKRREGGPWPPVVPSRNVKASVSGSKAWGASQGTFVTPTEAVRAARNGGRHAQQSQTRLRQRSSDRGSLVRHQRQQDLSTISDQMGPALSKARRETMPRKCLIKFWIAAAMLGAFTVGHHAHGHRSKSSTAATRLSAAAVAPATLSPRGGR